MLAVMKVATVCSFSRRYTRPAAVPETTGFPLEAWHMHT